jgi:hypothetical protein
LAPDDISFRGEKKMDQVLLRLIDFDAENLEESKVESVKDVLASYRSDGRAGPSLCSGISGLYRDFDQNVTAGQ